MHNDFAESLLTRGLSPLPVCVLDNEQLTIQGLRRYVIRRFPFIIFYLEFETLIWVVAIAHGKRKPDYWKKRKLE